SNQTMFDFLPAEYRTKIQIVSPNALRPQDEDYAPREVQNREIFRLLYVGNCVATRAIPIVFEALRNSGLTEYEFVLVGEGPALKEWRRQSVELGLGARVRFEGKVPY